MKKFKGYISVFMVVCVVVLWSGIVYGAEKAPAAAKPEAKTAKININTAGVPELMKLPRIGEKIAKRIIEFRDKNGKFKQIQDIMKVKGIGEKTFQKFEKMITV